MKASLNPLSDPLSLEYSAHYRKPHLIPISLQQKVCMCIEYTSTDHSRTRLARRMQCCGQCGKPFRWYVRKCVDCKTWFIKDFYKRGFECPRHNRCWDCVNQVTESCDCYGTPNPTVGKESFEPLGLNPKKYTQAELDSVFDKSPFD